MVIALANDSGSVINSGVGAIRLVSPTGFAEGDTRPLGAAIGRIELDGTALPLDDLRLREGFHPAEPCWRCTDGLGVIVLGAREATTEVTIEVVSLAPRQPLRGRSASKANPR